MLIILIHWLFRYASYFDMLLICYVVYLLFSYFDMLIYCYDDLLLCQLFDMAFIWYGTYLIWHLFDMALICYDIYLICVLFVMLDICYACCSFFLLCCETLWYVLVNLFVIQLVDVFSGMLVLFMVWSYLMLFLYSIPHFSSCYMNIIYMYTNLKSKLMGNFDGVLLQIYTENAQQIENTYI